MSKKITYAQVGDDYYTKDPINKLSQKAARATGVNLKKAGYGEISDTRGESAFVWKQGNILMASVIECLGTKNLIADSMRKITGKIEDPERSRRTYYDVIAQDTVATFINDLSTVGAKPLVVHAYWAVEDNSWLHDKKRMTDFINGWKKACDLADATWGGGETSTLKGIITPQTVNLGGSVVGIVKSEKRLVTDQKLKNADRIVLIRSNGINANGISLARKVSEKLPNGYGTKINKNKMYGEALLTPTNIYAKVIQDILDNGVDIHYIVNITGHGLRKIMRARKNFTYQIEKLFPPQEVFKFIQKHANLNDYEMYQTYNMGQDYAIFVAQRDVKKAQSIISKNKFHSLDAGVVSRGPRQVILKPKNITFTSETLDLR